MITFNRVSNGEFDVLKDGINTSFRIFNGSRGLSGNGKNLYGIFDCSTKKTTMVGSLQLAKKTVAFWLK